MNKSNYEVLLDEENVDFECSCCIDDVLPKTKSNKSGIYLKKGITHIPYYRYIKKFNSINTPTKQYNGCIYIINRTCLRLYSDLYDGDIDTYEIENIFKKYDPDMIEYVEHNF